MCPSITHLPRSGTPTVQPASVIAMPPARGSGLERQPAAAELATTPVTRAAAAANGGSAVSSPASSVSADAAAKGAANGQTNGHSNGHADRQGARRQSADRKGPQGQKRAATPEQQQQPQPQPRAGSKRSRQQQPLELVAGREAVGRRLSVWWQRPQEWVEGRLKEFDAATGKHRVVYDGQQGAGDAWLALSSARFQWLSEPRHGQGPNPTFASLPAKEELVGARVKVFWPGMGRWYLGTVKGYDARTKKHKVAYKDGDLKLVNLRHEAVLIAEDSPVPPVPTAKSPAASPPANGRAAGTPGSGTPCSGGTPGSAPPSSGRGGGSRGAPRTPGSSGRKAAAAAPKQPAKPAAKALAPEAAPEPDSPDSSSGRDGGDGSGSGSDDSPAPVQAPRRQPNADRRRDRQQRQDSRAGRSSSVAVNVAGATGVSKVSASGPLKPRPDTKAGRAARRATAGKSGKAPAAEDSSERGSQPPADAEPVNGKRSRADDDETLSGSPPKVARVETPPQQAPQSPAASAKQASAAQQQQQQQQQQTQLQPQLSGLCDRKAAPQPQLPVTSAAGTVASGVALGPIAAFRAVLSAPTVPPAIAAQPSSRPPPPRNGQLKSGKPQLPQNGKPQTSQSGQPQQRQQQLPPAVCMPPPPPAGAVGFSPKATTLQAALAMPLTTSPAQPPAQEAASRGAYQVCRPEDDPLRMAASLLRGGQRWQPAPAPAAPAAPPAQQQPQLPAPQPKQQPQVQPQLQPALPRAQPKPQPQQPPQLAPVQQAAVASAAGPPVPQPPPQQQPQQQPPQQQPQQQQQPAAVPQSAPRPLSPIRVRLPVPAQRPEPVGVSPMLPPPEPARRSKLPDPGTPLAQPGSAGSRPLRAARLAAAVAGGVNRGDGALAGARIAVYWREDAAYYKGTLAALDGYHKRARVAYDDGEEEWLSLPRHAFRWLSPRGRTAGCSEPLKRALCALGAQGIAEEQLQPPADGAGPQQRLQDGIPPAGQAAVGQRVAVWCPGNGEFHTGEVLQYDRHRGQHHVLYEDGEDEALRLGGETVRWLGPASESPCAAGLPAGKPVPRGQAVVGWRIGVWWPHDRTFYVGDVTSYNSATGRHSVLYDDGEREAVLLASEKLKWLLPPEAADADVASVNVQVGPSEEATAARHQQKRQPRRRHLVESSDEDDDEEYLPRGHSRPSSQRQQQRQQHSQGQQPEGGRSRQLPGLDAPLPPQQPPPGARLVAERWLPSMAPLGLAPNRPGSTNSQLQSLGAGSTSSLFSRLSQSSSGEGGGGGAAGPRPLRVAIYAPRRTQPATAGAAAAEPAAPIATAAKEAAAAAGAACSAPAAQPALEAAVADAPPVSGAGPPVADAVVPESQQACAQQQVTAAGAPAAAGSAAVAGATPAADPAAADLLQRAAAAAQEPAPPQQPAASVDVLRAERGDTAAAAAPAAGFPAAPLQRRLSALDAALARVLDGERRMAHRSRVALSTRRLLGGKLPVPEAARASGTPTGGRSPSVPVFGPTGPGSAPPASGPVAGVTPYTPAAAAGPLRLNADSLGVPSGLASAPPCLGLLALQAPPSGQTPATHPAPATPAPKPTLVPAATKVSQPPPQQRQLLAAAAAPAKQQVQQAPLAASPAAPVTLQELLRGPVAADGSPKTSVLRAAVAAPAADIGSGVASGVVKPLSEAAAAGTGRSVPDIAALPGAVSSSDEDAALVTATALLQQQQLKQEQELPPNQSAGLQQGSGSSKRGSATSSDCRAAAGEPGCAHGDGPKQQVAH